MPDTGPDAGQDAGQDTVLDRTRIVLRPLASPLPLGLFSFALGSLVLGVGQLGGFGPTGGDPALTVMLAVFVALPQLVAAVIAFLTREATVATLLGLAGMSWPATLAVQLAAPGPTNAPRGVLFLGIGTLLVLLALTAVAAKPLVAVLVLVAGARFAANGLYDVTAVAWIETVSGVAALGTTLLAGYLGIALGLEDTRHRTVLPTGRRGAAAQAFTEGLPTQVASLPHEAGVRNQL